MSRAPIVIVGAFATAGLLAALLSPAWAQPAPSEPRAPNLPAEPRAPNQPTEPHAPSQSSAAGAPMAWPGGKDREGQVRLGEVDYQPVPGIRIKVAPFALDADEVSRELYEECVSAGKCVPAPPSEDKNKAAPVRAISFTEAAAYCTFRGRRLPRESEWLRAAFPAGKGQKGFGPAGLGRVESEVCVHLVIAGFDGDDCPTERTNADGKVILFAGKPEATHHRVLPVGEFVKPVQKPGAVIAPSRDVTYPEGAPVFHLFGNVAEWVVTDDAKKARTTAIIRGGSFKRKTGLAIKDRGTAAPGERFDDVGFRCARDLSTVTP